MSARTKEIVAALWLPLIVFLIILASSVSNAQNIEGQLIASQYGMWQVSGYAPDTYSGFAPTACRVQGGSSFFPAFTVGTPLMIVDGNPSLTEVVTPTNVVINNNTCAISISPVNHHNLPFYLTSATAGLQEAINANLTSPATNTIILSNDWYRMGGSPLMIFRVEGSANLGLVDVTTVPSTFYRWNGIQYVQVSDFSPISSVFGRTGAITAIDGDYTCLEVTGCGSSPNAYLATTLSASVGPTDTTIPLSEVPSTLSSFGAIVIDSEWIAYTGIFGNTLIGATRGYHQTVAASHNSGAQAIGVLVDFTNSSQAPQNYVISGEGPDNSLFVFGCTAPDEKDQVFVQLGCAGTGVEITDGYNILQDSNTGENKLQAATGIGPGGGKAPITDSGYLFDSTRQNNSTVTQGFSAGITPVVAAVQPPTITAPTVINFVGTGTTTWSWRCTGTDQDGNNIPGTDTTITNGPATVPSGTGFFITCPFSSGAVSESIWRTAGPDTTGLIITQSMPAAFEDTNLSFSGTPSAANTTVPKVCTNGEQWCELSGPTSTPAVTCASGTQGECTGEMLYKTDRRHGLHHGGEQLAFPALA